MITFQFLFNLIKEQPTQTLKINNLSLSIEDYIEMYGYPTVVIKNILMINADTKKVFSITNENWDEHFAMFRPYKSEIIEFIKNNFAHKIIFDNL